MKHWPAGAAVVAPGAPFLFPIPRSYLAAAGFARSTCPSWNTCAIPSVLAKDILVERPHVTFTLYDECALALRKLTGLEFREVLGWSKSSRARWGSGAST